MSKLKIFDYRRKKPNSISPQEIKAVIHHLKYTYHFFRHIPYSNLENLINYSKVIDIGSPDEINELKMNRSPYDYIENNGLMLYKKNEKTDYGYNQDSVKDWGLEKINLRIQKINV